jgi:phosphomannomutase
MIDPGIFKAYDIRGTVPDQMTEEVAYRVGRALVLHLACPAVAVGRDMRLSSPMLAAALIRGITDQGADAVDLGLTSTDQLYFAVGKFGYPAGVMVTASHNPKEYNGFKICREQAIPLSSAEGLDKIKALVLAGNFPAASPGRVTQRDTLAEYVDYALTFIDPAKIKPWRIVVDAGNGMAGQTLPAVFDRLPCQLIPLYFELDGSFPHHPASPIEPENMVDLQRAVREQAADLGAAFDGDADRMFIVDEHANLIGGDMVTALVSQNLLRKHPGSIIIYNLICSRTVPEVIERNGGIPYRSRVGHSFIKADMRRLNAIFGGEHSGHFYFRDFWYADSGLIALLVTLELLSEEGKRPGELLAPLDTRFRSGEINTRVTDIPAKLAAVMAHFADGQIDQLDGITISYPDWWFNLRPSNTEPLLRLNVEADTKELLDRRTAEVLAIIRS